jgi:hypothetical protein
MASVQFRAVKLHNHRDSLKRRRKVEDKQDETIKDRILSLLRKGYKRGQLVHDFGFAERTVDAAISAHRQLGNGNTGDNKESGDPDTDDRASAPPSKNRSKGATGTTGRDGVLAIRKEKESILPEWLESDVAEIFDGQTRDQRIFLAGMSVPLMGLRLFAEGVRPIIDLLATWQEGQAQAARAAQGSSIEMAQAAGEAAATGVGKFFMDTKPWLATAPDPVKAMIVDTMRPMFQQLMGQVMGGLMRGFVSMAGQSGTSGQPVTAQPGQPPQGQPPAFTSGAQQVSEQEMEEVFKHD